MSKRRKRRTRGKLKRRVVVRPQINKKIQHPNNMIPLAKLPLYNYLEKKESWDCLLPEILAIQAKWIKEHKDKITVDENMRNYLNNAVALLYDAIVVAGNDRAYFALYSLRSILERVAMIWTCHTTSPVAPTDILTKLSSSEEKVRKDATISFVELARSGDDRFGALYDMTSQYFAHSSKMDSVVLEQKNEKDALLRQRAKALPLLLIFETGQRIVNLLQALGLDQKVEMSVLDGGRKTYFSYDLDKYVCVSAHIMCEMHTLKNGLALSTLYKNDAEVKGSVGIRDIYRGGMTLERIGSPEEKPNREAIAGYAIFAIGKGFESVTKAKLIEEDERGERYTLSWPKHIEVDSTVPCFIANNERKEKFEYDWFDYVDKFIEVIVNDL